MLYEIQAGRLRYEQAEDTMGEEIAIIAHNEMIAQLNEEDAFDRLLIKALSDDTIRYERHDGMDVCCMAFAQKQRMHVFRQARCLWIVIAQCAELDQQLNELMASEECAWTLHKVFAAILMKQLKGADHALDQFQEQLVKLEEDVIKGRCDKEMVTHILQLRTSLLQRANGYGLTQDALSALALNENRFYREQECKELQLLHQQVTRLVQRVSGLQDYVSELRDAYQTQMDIDLNVTMRIFTVMTALFLPLSLITSWYGMNFDMPEYAMQNGYVFVLAISVLLTIALLIYFKRHRWF